MENDSSAESEKSEISHTGSLDSEISHTGSLDSDIPGLEDMLNILVIGDTHFKEKDFEAGEELIQKCHETARELQPTKIVLLGDILDTHEISRQTPYDQAFRFIEGLSEIAHVYVCMGNHDYINASQFLTDKHFFNPYKKWPNVTIVDHPICVSLNNLFIVLCPYVPPGRFEEALDQTKILFEGDSDTFDWRTDATCIFAHQEIEGVEYNGKQSTKGDRWDENYPPLFCGHIHQECDISENMSYVGSSRQVDSNENPDKRIWNVSFDDENKPEIDKIDLCLKGKKEIHMTCDSGGGRDEDSDDLTAGRDEAKGEEKIPCVQNFDFELAEKYYIKIKLHGTPEQFKVFQKSHLRAKLKQHNVGISFIPNPTEKTLELLGCSAMGENISFENIFKKVVENKSMVVQREYRELFGETVKIVFEDESDED